MRPIPQPVSRIGGRSATGIGRFSNLRRFGQNFTPNTLALDNSTFAVGTPSTANILGATGGTIITSPDIPSGFTVNSLARTVSYDGSGSASSGTFTLVEAYGSVTNSSSINYSTIAYSAPVNTSLPIVSTPGTAGGGVITQPGYYLAGTDGVWVADPPASFTYAWKVGGSIVPGETNNQYLQRTADAGKSIQFGVTANNGGTPVTVWSNAVGPVTIPGGATIDGTVEAPTLTRITANNVWPLQFKVKFPSYAVANSYSIELQNSPNENFSSTPIDITSVITNAEALAGSKTISGLSSIASPNITYSRARVVWTSGGTTYASRWSNICGHGDSTAPVISTSGTASVIDGEQLRVLLAANKTCTYAITGGVDQTWFEINSANYVEWFGDGVQSYANPLAQGASNTYSCTIVGTDLFGNPSAPLNLAVTVGQLGTPSFSFTPQTMVARSTPITSAPAPVTGMTPNHVYSASSTCPYRISTDGGSTYGPWQPAGVVPGGLSNNPTIELQPTSSGSYSTETDFSFTIGGTTATFAVTTQPDPTAKSISGPLVSGTGTTSIVLSVSSATACRIIHSLGQNSASSVVGSVSGAFGKVTITGNTTKHDVWIVNAAPAETITITFPGGTTWGEAAAFVGANLTSVTPAATAFRALASSNDPKAFGSTLTTPNPGISFVAVRGSGSPSSITFNNGGTKLGQVLANSGTALVGYGTMPPGTATPSFSDNVTNTADGVAVAWS